MRCKSSSDAEICYPLVMQGEKKRASKALMLQNPIVWREMRDISKDKEVIESSLDLVSTRHGVTLTQRSPWGIPGLTQAAAPSPLLPPTGTLPGQSPAQSSDVGLATGTTDR